MFMELGGRQVFVVDFGDGGVPFVAHSGWIGTWEDWEPQLAAMSRTHRAIGFDHRGTGRTGGDPAAVTFDRLVEDVFALLDALGIDRCVLGGFSSGNRVVQEAVARQPDRFAGLILMCPATSPAADEQFADLLLRDHDTALDAFVDACLPEPDSDHVRRWALDVLHQASTEQSVALLRALTGPTATAERPGTLRLPTLIVQGDEDPFSPLDYGRALAAAIPGAGHVVVPGGHLIAQTRPTATALPMVDFLATLD